MATRALVSQNRILFCRPLSVQSYAWNRPQNIPEQDELARKREELALLQATVVERELFLTNLRAELLAFEGQYLRRVGTLYAELDEWNARIAERQAEEKGTESRDVLRRKRAHRPKSPTLLSMARPPGYSRFSPPRS